MLRTRRRRRTPGPGICPRTAACGASWRAAAAEVLHSWRAAAAQHHVVDAAAPAAQRKPVAPCPCWHSLEAEVGSEPRTVALLQITDMLSFLGCSAGVAEIGYKLLSQPAILEERLGYARKFSSALRAGALRASALRARAVVVISVKNFLRPEWDLDILYPSYSRFCRLRRVRGG